MDSAPRKLWSYNKATNKKKAVETTSTTFNSYPPRHNSNEDLILRAIRSPR